MNLSTALIGLAVLAVFAAIVAGEIKKRRSGCGGCSCACGGCPNASGCGHSSGDGDPPDAR